MQNLLKIKKKKKKRKPIGGVPLFRGVNARPRIFDVSSPPSSLRPPIHLPSLLVVFSSGRGARVRRDCAVSATEFTDMENPFFREKKRTRSRGRGRHRVPASQRENLACFFLFFASFCQFTTSPFFSSPFWAWIEDE